MAVTIRLARAGRNHYACYRISVADSHKAATGKFLQQIGHYDPNQTPPALKIEEEAAVNWLMKGATMSETVETLFKRAGVLERFKQVKSGKAFEETEATAKAFDTKKDKPSKKAIAKKKAKEEAEAKAKEEAAAPAEETTKA